MFWLCALKVCLSPTLKNKITIILLNQKFSHPKENRLKRSAFMLKLSSE